MKKCLNFIVVAFLSVQIGFAQFQCGTINNNSGFEPNSKKLQYDLRDVLTIPVVFHILYNNAEENISEEQVMSQLDILNQNYRALDPMDADVPDEFASLVADVEIEFCLATRDPFGFETTGIIKKSTTKNCFHFTTPEIFFTSEGGNDVWDTDSYLNIYVSDICANFNGYAFWPGWEHKDGTDSNFHGVNIDYKSFGTVGTAESPYSMGNVAVHEIGHWLSLRHLYTDEIDGDCTDDFISDTPIHDHVISGCGSYPSGTGCVDGENEMPMNYMTAADDECRYMFTQGQKNAMRNALINERSGILESMGCQTPNTCMPVVGINVLFLNECTIKIGWDNNGETDFVVMYKKVDDTNFNSITTSSNSYQFDNLDPNTEYEFQITSNCNDNLVSITAETLQDNGGCSICAEDIDIVLSGNQSLQQFQISGDLIISSGTLTINQKVEFSASSKVIVKLGAKLIVEGNGILTKCPEAEFWQGVRIETNPSPFGSTTGRGIEIRDGGTIEYANIGVYKSLSQGASAGTLPSLKMTNGAIIRNCDKGVYFNNNGNSFGFLGEQENSIIEDSYFYDNDIAINLRFNDGMTLRRNTFLDNYYGVEVTNSSVDIVNNNFADIGVGILLNAMYPSLWGMNITNNVFTSGHAIDTESLNNASYLFIDQNVSLSAPMYVHGLVDFQVTANDFIDCTRAMEYSATGSNNDNLVYGNSFSNNSTGINVDGNNNMEYRFNCFENTKNADIGLGYGTSIREDQGNPIDEAANCFDNGSRIQTIDDDPALAFKYWKYPQPSGNPNWDCKEPKQYNTGQNYVVEDAEEEINEGCGSGIYIYGPYPNFLLQYRDCQDFISRNFNDVGALEDLITSLKEEIDRLEQEVDLGQMNDLIASTLINKYKECIEDAMKNIVTTILHNPTGDPRDRAITYLSSESDFTFNIMAYSLMMSANEYYRALTYLSTLSPLSEDEHDFIEVQSIYHKYLINQQGFVLSATDRSIIYDAGMKRLELAGFARKLYHKLTGERIFLEVPLYNDPRGATREVGESSSLVNIYPNPSVHNSDITLEIDVDILAEYDYDIKVYSAQGDFLMEDKIRYKRQILSISDHKGLLLVTVERDGEIIHTQKLIRL